MSQQPIALSKDLQRLRDEGYAVCIEAGYLLLRDVPYVAASRVVKRGTLVSTLNLAGDVALKPETHVTYFIGEQPCDASGTPLTRIMAGGGAALAGGLVAQHTFSSKPLNGYENYYDKMTAYVRILEHEAHGIDANATAKTFAIVAAGGESVFEYADTASSRAKISALNDRLREHTLAIVGLGGTGSYILDFVAKTPVREIHLYDGDRFGQHNAFRAPGAPGIDDLRSSHNKATYYRAVYSRMRKGVIDHPYYVDATNVEELRQATFVFLCVDRAGARKVLIERLEAFEIPFIDVGMGMPRSDDALTGILRVTTSTTVQRSHVRELVPLADVDVQNEYDTNVQIADLNALNAALAVVKWKKLCGSYADTRQEHHTTYTIRANMIVNEEEK
ncbi:MAG: ThiF family adenylyltransferase [Acidobacteria bacterium]|nr:ThiF family adenylyltransferase [Acidobacteriota bacterium]